MRPLSIKQAKKLLAKPRISDETAMRLIKLFEMDIQRIVNNHRTTRTWVAMIRVSGGWRAMKDKSLNSAIQNVAKEKIAATARGES